MPTESLSWILLVRHLILLVLGYIITLFVVKTKLALLLVDVMGHQRQEL